MENQDFNPEQLFQQAIQAHQAGQLDKAETYLRQILEKLPEQDGIMSALGGVLLSGGKTQEGISILEKAIQLNANNVDAKLNLGIAYQSIGKVEESYQLIEQAASLAPNRADIQFNFSNILLQRQDYPKAIEVLHQVIKLNPSLIQAYQSLGAVYSYLQKFTESKDIYEKALTVAPNDLNTQLTLGNLYSDMGEVDQAQKLFLQATEQHATHYLPYAILGKFYLDIGKDTEGQEALEKAYSLNPNDLNTNILLGNVSNTFGRVDDAEKYYQQALRIDPNDKDAKNNLRRILATKIPYWHFEMLADTQRNDAYQEAIEKVINKDSVVLDIGTGSGLLAMMAARAGAQQITACEMHERLAAAAKVITKQNGFEASINVLSKKSTQLKVGVDMPAKANLIISEILDAGGIGEGVLPSIRHAVQNLATSTVQLIPAKLHLFGQLIEIPSRSLVSPIRKISGFDLSFFEQFRIGDEYMKINLKAEKYKPLSDVIPLFDIDFYNLPPVYPNDQAKQIPLDLTITDKGMAQAMVFWFDLYLDEEIMVSSKLDGELEHWGQALFCFSNPKEVQQGQQFPITLFQSDHKIWFEI